MLEDDRDELYDQGSNRLAWFITGALVGAAVGVAVRSQERPANARFNFRKDAARQGRRH